MIHKPLSLAVLLCSFSVLSLMGADDPIVSTPKEPKYKMPDKGPERNAMHARYKAAKTWEERRALCVECIDSQIIDLGVELGPLVELFTIDGIAPTVTDESPEVGHFCVYFQEQPEPKNLRADASYFNFGWYFIAKYKKGKIYSYCLTNIYKAPAPIPVIDDK